MNSKNEPENPRAITCNLRRISLTFVRCESGENIRSPTGTLLLIYRRMLPHYSAAEPHHVIGGWRKLVFAVDHWRCIRERRAGRNHEAPPSHLYRGFTIPRSRLTFALQTAVELESLHARRYLPFVQTMQSPSRRQATFLDNSKRMFTRFAYMFAFLLIGGTRAITAQTFRTGNPSGKSLQGSVHGTVKDSTGHIFPGAVLTLTTPGGNQLIETTKDDGTFTFAGLAPATYMLTAGGPGLEPLYTRVVKIRTHESALANMIMFVKPTSN